MAAASKKKRNGRPLAAWSWRAGLVFVVVGLAAGGWFWEQKSRRGRERERAVRLFKEGRIKDAEPLLTGAFAHDPADLEVVKALARIAGDAQQFDRVADYLSRWCALRPDDLEPFRLRMEFSKQQGKIDLAVADGVHVLEIAPHDPSLRNQVIGYFVVNGRHTETEQFCRQRLVVESSAPDLLYYLAEACHGQGKDDEARQLLDRALSARPGFPDALLLQAVLLREAGEEGRAVPLLRKALGGNPALQPARYHLSLALARTGKTEEANAEMAEFLKWKDADRLYLDCQYQPNNLELRARAAEALWRYGRKDDARALVRAILNRDPRFAAAVRLQKTMLEAQKQ